MPPVRAADARREIAGIIGESVVQAEALKQALQDERVALEQRDTEALHAIVNRKNRCARKLTLLDEKIGGFCNDWGFSDGPDSVQRLLAWCDEHNELGQCWQTLMQTAVEGNALNLTNGAIIRLRQQHTESSLALLRGIATGPDTYGNKGEESGDFGRRTIAEA